jgi:hypothetical protein
MLKPYDQSMTECRACLVDPHQAVHEMPRRSRANTRKPASNRGKLAGGDSQHGGRGEFAGSVPFSAPETAGCLLQACPLPARQATLFPTLRYQPAKGKYRFPKLFS